MPVDPSLIAAIDGDRMVSVPASLVQAAYELAVERRTQARIRKDALYTPLLKQHWQEAELRALDVMSGLDECLRLEDDS